MITNRIAYYEGKVSENLDNWTGDYFRAQLESERGKVNGFSVGQRVITIDGRRRTIKEKLANGWFGLSDGAYTSATQLRGVGR